MDYPRFRVFLTIFLLLLFLAGCESPSAPEIPPTTEAVETTLPDTEPTAADSIPTQESSTPAERVTEEPTFEETAPPVYIPWYETSRLIYHAGGAIGSMSYTNSKEAIEKTLEDGNRLLEIDFLFTSDGHLVCLHEWQNLQGRNQPCSLETFLSLKIYYQYTTITAEDFLGYMRAYPDLYLIVDTKEQNAVEVVAELLRLCDYDASVADRFVIQLYDGGMKAQILELYPFTADNFLFTAYKYGPYRITDIMNLCLEEEIRIVTVPYGSWDKATVQKFNDAGFYVFEHTVNYTSMTDNGLARGVYGFYTDSLQESDLGIETDN